MSPVRSLRYRHSGGFSEWRLSTLCGSSAQSSRCKAKTQLAIMFDERFVKGVRSPYDHVLMFAQATSASVSSATSSLASSGLWQAEQDAEGMINDIDLTRETLHLGCGHKHFVRGGRLQKKAPGAERV